ncbi:helix-turn-helix transcriptional regulator [Streptomyces lasalocidi]
MSTLLTAQTLLGKHDEAARTLTLRVPDVMFETPSGLFYLLARGRYYIECGLPEAAVDDFRAVGDLLEQWGLELAGILPWRAELAAAYLQLGDRDAAARYAQDQLRRMRPGHLRARGRTLGVLAATRELRLRPPVLREAVDVLHRSGDRFELVSALTALHHVYTQLGQTGRARSVARKANSIAQSCHAERAVTSEAVPNAMQDTAADMLSDAERRVAELAAKGHTNREIADKLYVTASTVEQHLTRIYRKLGIVSRQHLQSRLGPELAFPGPVEM